MCYSKIREEDVAVKIDEDVFGYDVVMNHVFGLKVADSGKELGESISRVEFG